MTGDRDAVSLVGILKTCLSPRRMVHGSWNAATRCDVQINIFLLKAKGRGGASDSLWFGHECSKTERDTHLSHGLSSRVDPE